MDFEQWVVLLVTILAVVAGVALYSRAANKRIRLLAFSVALLTVCQTVAIVGRYLQWDPTDYARSLEVLELTAAALSLCVVHLLNRENKDRRSVDAQLRVLAPVSVTAPSPTSPGRTGSSGRQADQRISPRIQTNGSIVVRDVAEGNKPLYCEVRNVSKSGLGLMADEWLAIGKTLEFELEIEGQGTGFRAIVVHSQPAGEGFIVGLLLDSQLSDSQINEFAHGNIQHWDKARA